MTFFDYVYYKVSKFYTKSDENGASFSGVIVLALLQFANLMTAVIFIYIAQEKRFNVSKLVFLLPLLLLVILDGVRYNKLTFTMLDERWVNEVDGKKHRNQLLVVLYIFLTMSLFVGSAIYIGSQHW